MVNKLFSLRIISLIWCSKGGDFAIDRRLTSQLAATITLHQWNWRPSIHTRDIHINFLYCFDLIADR
jgi:hypothetical protein